ncbi:N-acetylmuramic acid 6-phosphate etherase [Helcobacillus sp. ACRRO]|uniref:N-acetylmuramic acid 6-phosphate etherase n=1 Tax=Helcobacillus sp. ACRRO TaxID=2918202 RepID=UPI001EF63CEC|nr:N-acetylmuramic acid 6-phosphate etherase [Helcobacillus sp. ACRRO]MCG7426986.1 N-acetylmuramic acid 6-phosphate etherase [Helcobacillus sp. ACRRO]
MSPRTDWDPDVLGVLLAPMEGTELSDFMRSALASGLGGITLFAPNTPTLGATQRLCAQIRDAGADPIIAIDEEGGRVTRLFGHGDGFGGPPGRPTDTAPLTQAETSRHEGPLPAAAVFGRADDEDLTARAGAALGALLAELGITMDFAPVADVATNPENPLIGHRAFSSDPAAALRHAAAFTRGLHSAGVAACAKHFPGHGDADTDSHLSMPTIRLDRATVLSDHAEPFSALWTGEMDGAAAVDAVMTGHLEVPALGDGPASLSRWSADLLDEIGFTGVIVTDALDMGAVTHAAGFGDGCIRALEAGAHLLCLGSPLQAREHDLLTAAHDAILGAVGSGRLTREQLRDAHQRAARCQRARRVTAPTRPASSDLEPLVAHLWQVGDEARAAGESSVSAADVPTEQRNERTRHIDTVSTPDAVDLILAEEQTSVDAVRSQAAQIAELAEICVDTIVSGGTVHYVGAGTSGRLAVLDAAELLPTFNADSDVFAAHLAGGPSAMFHAVEGAEDSSAAGAALIAEHCGGCDTVIGLAASGRTPFVRGALEAARARRLRTGLISANPSAPLAGLANVAVLLPTGPEAIAGSTRMKAGTAQKMALNALSTATMVRLGTTYENLMIDVRATNEKLVERTARILATATGIDADGARAALRACDGELRTALVILLAGEDPTDPAVRESARAARAAAPPDPSRDGDPSGIRTAAEELRRA